MKPGETESAKREAQPIGAGLGCDRRTTRLDFTHSSTPAFSEPCSTPASWSSGVDSKAAII